MWASFPVISAKAFITLAAGQQVLIHVKDVAHCPLLRSPRVRRAAGVSRAHERDVVVELLSSAGLPKAAHHAPK